MARIVLPLSLYTSFWFTVNARSLMNFLALRNAPAAQWEIQQYAVAIEALFGEVMPLTYAAFVKSGRVAP
jgi:thymidylate synthase (FAD)